MKQYKLHTLETGFFSSDFNAEKVEHILNGYAQHGWVLKETIRNPKNDRNDEFHFLLERDV